jgi:hypothetical protein
VGCGPGGCAGKPESESIPCDSISFKFKDEKMASAGFCDECRGALS